MLVKGNYTSTCAFIFNSNKVTLLVFLAHCLFAVVDTGFDSLYSLWCATPLYLGTILMHLYHIEHSILSCVGGIGFSVRDIGLTSTVVGALFLPFSLFTYPLVSPSRISFVTRLIIILACAFVYVYMYVYE